MTLLILVVVGGRGGSGDELLLGLRTRVEIDKLVRIREVMICTRTRWQYYFLRPSDDDIGLNQNMCNTVEGMGRVIVPLTTGKGGINISDRRRRGRRGRRGSGMSLVVALRGRDLSAGRVRMKVRMD